MKSTDKDQLAATDRIGNSKAKTERVLHQRILGTTLNLLLGTTQYVQRRKRKCLCDRRSQVDWQELENSLESNYYLNSSRLHIL